MIDAMKHPRRILIGIVALVAALWGADKVSVLYVDYLWFDVLGYGSVYTTALWTKIALAGGAFLVTVLWLTLNIILAGRMAPGRYIKFKHLPWVIPSPQLKRTLKFVAVAGVLLVAYLMAQAALHGSPGENTENWFGVLQAIHSVPFGQTDPILHRDASFYVFVLPMLMALKALLLGLVLATLVAVAATYFVGGAIAWPGEPITRPAAVHLSVLAAILTLVMAFGYWLDQFDLLLSSHGAVFGVGYADDNIRLPVLRFMTFICIVAGILMVLAGILRRTKVAYVAVALIVIVHVIGMWSYPAFVQRFEVEPNELTKESPYIGNNIQATRFAYDLADVEVRPYSSEGTLTLQEVKNVPGTIESVRIWDWQVLLATFNQIQSLRPYYHFNDVDVDRYAGDGQYRQVTLAVRELETGLLNPDSRTWVNLHLLYTHGYGLVANPVNSVTSEGMPELWVRDIPPQSAPQSKIKLNITQPAIYFGELSQEAIYVGTRDVEGHPPEFDYPLGDQNRYAAYSGRGGVPMGSLWRRIMLAWYFRDWNVLLTDSFTPETRVLWDRQIARRVQRLAPFLEFDADPYPVVHDGRIVWIIDAYTETDKYPYSSRTGFRGHAGANYIRNSVKAVVDAYDGTVTFYVIDSKDPLIQTARAIFPTLFRDISEMPDGLRAHLRYPNDLFEIQADQYLAYHMTDPQIFYNKEDLWQRPRHLAGDTMQYIPAYYFIMTLPGAEKPEFLLMLPFTPAKKDNMVGWMAGRCDGADYGKRLVYTFPKDRLVFGPNQVEARINQNDRISPLLTLWNQHGSRVVRGNLLVIPVGNSILYVEPLYLKSEQAAIPELKRVIVSYQDRVAMENTLDEAMAAVFNKTPSSSDPLTPIQFVPPITPAAASLRQRALDLFDRGQQELRNGKWAEYGATQEELRKVLQDLAKESPPK
jgi:uncharacterized protein